MALKINQALFKKSKSTLSKIKERLKTDNEIIVFKCKP